MVVVVVFSAVVPESLFVTEPLTVVDVDEDGCELAGGAVTTVVDELLAGGGVVVLGTTTVVFFSVVAGVVVLVVVVRSQPVITAEPTAMIAIAGMSFFMLSPDFGVDESVL